MQYLEQNAQSVNLIFNTNEIEQIEQIIKQFSNTGERYTPEALALVNH